MEETIRKISAIFDKMASVKITPTSNYAVHEYWMNRALKGDEKCKDTLFNWLSGILRVDKSVLNAVFNAKYNKTNENKKMNKKIIRLTESDLHRIVKESVQRILNESFNSSKLAAIAKEHGGVVWHGGYCRVGNGNNRVRIPIGELTDDMVGTIFGDEVVDAKDKRYWDENGIDKNGLLFNDGTMLPVKDKEAAINFANKWRGEKRNYGRYAFGYYGVNGIPDPPSDLQKIKKDLKYNKKMLGEPWKKDDPYTLSYVNSLQNWDDKARQTIRTAYKNGGKLDYSKFPKRP